MGLLVAVSSEFYHFSDLLIVASFFDSTGDFLASKINYYCSPDIVTE